MDLERGMDRDHHMCTYEYNDWIVFYNLGDTSFNAVDMYDFSVFDSCRMGMTAGYTGWVLDKRNKKNVKYYFFLECKWHATYLSLPI